MEKDNATLLDKIEKPAYFVSIFIYIGFIIHSYSAVAIKYIDRIVNSDALYLPAIYKDLFIDKIGLSGWQLNGAPNFFPDMPLYFIIHSFTENVITSALAYGVVQNLMIIGVVFLLCKQILKTFNWYVPTLINLLLLLPVLTGLYSPNLMFMHHLLINAYHTSSFIMSLFCFYLLIKYLNTKKLKVLISLFTFIVLSALSDKIFIIGFVFPALAVVVYQFIFDKNERRTHIKLFVGIIISVLLGHLIFKALASYSSFTFISKTFSVSMSDISASFVKIIDFMIAIVANADIASLIIVMGYGTAVALGAMIIKTLKENKEGESKLQLFYIFAFLYFGIILLIPVLTGHFKVNHHFRYNIFSFFMGVIAFGVILGVVLKQRWHQYATISLLVGMLLFLGVSFTTNKNKLSERLDYKPRYVTDLNSISQKNDLKKGVAPYWKARQARFLSDFEIDLYPIVYPKLVPLYFGTHNKNWFYKGESENPVFNYILLKNKKDIKKYEKWFGKKLKLVTHNKTAVLLVPDFTFDINTRTFQLIEQ